jgi:hypothetical protein
MQNFDHKIDFWEKRQFFRRKLLKIAGRLFILGSVKKIADEDPFWATFSTLKDTR